MKTPACLVFLTVTLTVGPVEGPASGQTPDRPVLSNTGGAPSPEARIEGPSPDPDEVSLGFDAESMPVDLATVLRLAGVENPQILLARQRVLEAVAIRQYAAAQLLPDVHLGTDYDDHNGNLQRSNGTILKVDRESVFVGAGAIAIAAGTVNIPGIGWNLNVSDTVFKMLESRQMVERARFTSQAVQNQMLLRVAVAYTNLLRAEGMRALARLTRKEAAEVARLTSEWAKAKAGREADKDRALSELGHRQALLLQAQGEELEASARLAELLNLNPATRLVTQEERVAPASVVPDPIALSELLTIGLYNRPELMERRAGIRQAFLALRASKLLPFSPNVIVGLSYGGEGGGSNLIAQPPGTDPLASGSPRFSNLKERVDMDAVVFWTLQNLGVGNVGMIRAARSRLATANLEWLQTMDQVRAEVARAYVASHARFEEIATAETAVRSIQVGYREDYDAVKGNRGRPVELLDSLRLLARAREEYLDAIIGYNQAQLELYVALGQPPANVLARPVPENYVPPLPAKEK
jgi:outer membrane protein TolC